MAADRPARSAALAQKAKLLREEYRGLQLELGTRLAGDDLAAEDFCRRRADLDWALQQLFALRDRLAALPQEVAATGYFDDVEPRIDALDDRRRAIIREDARREAARVRAELLALLGDDDAQGGERSPVSAEVLRAVGAADDDDEAAGECGGAEAAAEVAAGAGAPAATAERGRGAEEQMRQLASLLDEREEELRELKRTIARGAARSEEERARDREDAVAAWQSSDDYAGRVDAAVARGREDQRRCDEHERAEWRRRRDDAERQYMEQAAGRAAGAKQREAEFALHDRSLQKREGRLKDILATLDHVPEVAKVLPELRDLCA